MINITLMALAGVGLVVQFLTRRKQEHERPLALVIVQYSIMGAIIFLSGYSQLVETEKDAHYKRALLEVDVLSQVSGMFIPIMDDVVNIHNSMLTVKNYLSFEQAKRENPNIAQFINWHDAAADSHKLELKVAQESFHRIQRVAAEIVRINIEHEGIIPVNTMKWASDTLKIRFFDIEMYFDSYAPIGQKPKESVLDYHESLGNAFGSVLEKIRASSIILKG